MAAVDTISQDLPAIAKRKKQLIELPDSRGRLKDFWLLGMDMPFKLTIAADLIWV